MMTSTAPTGKVIPSRSGTPLSTGPPLGLSTPYLPMESREHPLTNPTFINQSNVRDTSATSRHDTCLDPRAMPQLSPEHFGLCLACLPKLFPRLSAFNRAHPNLPNALEHWQTQDLFGKLGTNNCTRSCQCACANPTQPNPPEGVAPLHR